MDWILNSRIALAHLSLILTYILIPVKLLQPHQQSYSFQDFFLEKRMQQTIKAHMHNLFSDGNPNFVVPSRIIKRSYRIPQWQPYRT
jgi:hypothetical protein